MPIGVRKKPRTAKQIESAKNNLKKYMESGKHPWNRGLPRTWESGVKKGDPKVCGKNNHKWKGGYDNTIRYNTERARMVRDNGGSHTQGEWENLKAQYNWTCPSCKKKEPEIKLQRDHIIPSIKGGSNNIENIQPLCRSCNGKKWTKTIKY